MTATDPINLEEVVRAGRVLFGPGFAADQAWWRDALRSTYRRRSFETHPDRARSLGRSETDLAREFQSVTEAYRILSQMRAGPLPAPSTVADPPRGRPKEPPRAHRTAHRAATNTGSAGPRPTPRPRPPPPPPRQAPPRAPEAPPPSQRSASARAGARAWPPGSFGAPRVRHSVRPEDLPRRRLRFAEFLYYSGRVPWTVFVDALVWQRAQRPALGRIAVEFGFLTPEEVMAILERRRLAAAQQTPFGEYALALGYVTPFQLLVMLGQQLRLQRRIGEFFVERGHIEEGDVDELRARLMKHNLHFTH
ncbi:MAG: J domain-containing protein [Anaeromyxobacter sp.]